MTLGLPPRQFDFAYRDKDNNYQSEQNITPQAFFEKYVGLKPSDYVSVINAPTADKPYGKSYTVEMLGNVVGAPSVRYLNLPMDRFKELAIAQMKSGKLFGLVQMLVKSQIVKKVFLQLMYMILQQAWILT